VNKLTGAVVLSVISLFMLVGFLASPAATTAATIAAVVLTVVLPGTGAVLLLRAAHADRRRLQRRSMELGRTTLDLDLLRLAREEDGRLTPVEAAMRLSVSPEAARDALDGLVARSLADLQVTEDGLLVYTFHELRLIDSKHTARGVLDA
jgi:hypothetical protein